MPNGTCSIEDCERVGRLVRGWCTMHYQRWFKYGDPLTMKMKTPEPQGPECSIENCPRPPLARGWCRRHYQNWLVHQDPEGAGRHYSYPASLFLRVTLRPDGCWEFDRKVKASGYGDLVTTPTGKKQAHVAMYEFMVGPIPPGYEVDHLCHVPGVCVMPKGQAHLCPHRCCVNPFHLRAVPAAENRRRTNATLIKYGTLSPKAQS